MDVRGAANSLFAVGWTMGLASAALGRTVLGGDAAAVGKLTGPWAKGLARVWGMQVRAFGSERIDTSRTYVFMVNHQSNADIVALLVALPIQPGFLAKKELRDVPVFGRAMEVGGHVFIDRKRRQDAFKAIADAAEQVAEGRSIAIFPEGTRGEGTEVRPFKKGGFHLAKQAGVPIVPVGIRGSNEVLPREGRFVHPGAVEVHIGEPIEPDTIASLDIDPLIGRVRHDIAQLIGVPVRG
ncbi:MAG: lysophospholipid acyltransferase family protein [Polyangiales bacterium]